jgi:DMSO/TMAO reductase YedYZ heme-binding membrane subunit
VLPFTSGYEPLWVGLGTIAFDLFVAVAVSSWLRDRISERAWRAVHWTAYLLWPLAVLHGFVLGTGDELILRGITLACGAAGAVAIVWRTGATHHDRERRRHIADQEWS